MKKTTLIVGALLLTFLTVATAGDFGGEREFLKIYTLDAQDRAVVSQLGFAVDAVDLKAGWVAAWVPRDKVERLKDLGFALERIDPPKTMPSGYDAYHDYSEQLDFLQQLATDYPAITDIFTIGASLEGRDMKCLKVSDNPLVDEMDEAAMVIVANHHAREILSVEPLLYAAQQLVEGYGVDEQLTYWIDTREIFLCPNVNPDGTEYDQSDDDFLYWRKNRRVNAGSDCRGVDPNRNYGYEWGGPGASSWPCDDTYRGTAAFSEPETAAFRDFVLAHPNLTTLITLHTYSELILYPWGHTYSQIGDETDRNSHQRLAELMAVENGYTPQQAAQLYPTNGDTTDWSYGELGIISFTFELSPGPWGWYDFYPPASFIDPANLDNWEAFKILLGFTADPPKVMGTDLWRLRASPATHDAALIEWASVRETRPQGWKVLRALSEIGPYEEVTGTFVAPNQGEYEYLDEGLEPETTYYYKVHYEGVLQNDFDFGPVFVTTPPGGDDDDNNDDDDDNDNDDNNDDDNNDDDDNDDDDDSGGCN